MITKSEPLFNFKENYLPGTFLPESRKQQIFDELLLKQKELANEIYITRCREKDL